MTDAVRSGSCLCGYVRYEVRGQLRPVWACHCGQCRKTTGHFWAATSVPEENMTIHEIGALRWFRSSKHAQRGFCSTCGSSLFWKMDGQEGISFGAGTLDGDTGLDTERHIFVEDKGDYYEIACTAPQIARY